MGITEKQLNGLLVFLGRSPKIDDLWELIEEEKDWVKQEYFKKILHQWSTPSETCSKNVTCTQTIRQRCKNGVIAILIGISALVSGFLIEELPEFGAVKTMPEGLRLEYPSVELEVWDTDYPYITMLYEHEDPEKLFNIHELVLVINLPEHDYVGTCTIGLVTKYLEPGVPYDILPTTASDNPDQDCPVPKEQEDANWNQFEEVTPVSIQKPFVILLGRLGFDDVVSMWSISPQQ